MSVSHWALLQAHGDMEWDERLDLRAASIPGLRCHVCGETWADISPLGLDLPDEIRGALPDDEPVGLEQFHVLRDEIGLSLALDEEKVACSLLPGRSFNPTSLVCRVAPPSVALLGGHLIVSPKVVDRIEDVCGLEASRWRRIPTQDADGRKIEDRYFILETDGLVRPHDWESRRVCEACGAVEWIRGIFDDDGIELEQQFSGLKFAEESMRCGDIWRLDSTLFFVVSDRVYRTLTEMDPEVHAMSIR